MTNGKTEKEENVSIIFDLAYPLRNCDETIFDVLENNKIKIFDEMAFCVYTLEEQEIKDSFKHLQKHPVLNSNAPAVFFDFDEYEKTLQNLIKEKNVAKTADFLCNAMICMSECINWNTLELKNEKGTKMYFGVFGNFDFNNNEMEKMVYYFLKRMIFATKKKMSSR